MSSPLKNKGSSWAGRPYAEISKDANYLDAYKRWHWGVNPQQSVEWEPEAKDDNGRALYPDAVIECGRLVELRFRLPDARKDMAMNLPKEQANRSHLCFDPDHPYERLYVLLPEDVRKGVKKAYWDKNPYEQIELNELAKVVGGRHGKKADYPAVKVRPVGILTSFVYACEKEGDGLSLYVHRVGEESGIRPCLAADCNGRLWIVGGNYTSPTAGVTD